MTAHYEFSFEIRSPDQQAEYDRLRDVLVKTLGLDWKAMPGAPDGDEMAEDCADALWDAGFRISESAPMSTTPSLGMADKGIAQMRRRVRRDSVRAEAIREVEMNIAAGWDVRFAQEAEFLTQFCRELARQADLIDGGLP